MPGPQRINPIGNEWNPPAARFGPAVPVCVAPSFSLAADPVTGDAPLTVQFTLTELAGTGPFTFSWTFGDGGISTLQSPSHEYAAAGSYAASVTITNACGTQTLGEPIDVSEAPVGCVAPDLTGAVLYDTFGGTPGSQIVNQPVEFAPTTILWQSNAVTQPTYVTGGGALLTTSGEGVFDDALIRYYIPSANFGDTAYSVQVCASSTFGSPYFFVELDNSGDSEFNATEYRFNPDGSLLVTDYSASTEVLYNEPGVVAANGWYGQAIKIDVDPQAGTFAISVNGTEVFAGNLRVGTFPVGANMDAEQIFGVGTDVFEEQAQLTYSYALVLQPEGIDRFYRFTGAANGTDSGLAAIAMPGHSVNYAWDKALSGDGLTLAMALKPSASVSTWATTDLYVYRRANLAAEWVLYYSQASFEVAAGETANYVCLNRDGTRLAVVCSSVSPFRNNVYALTDDGATFVSAGTFDDAIISNRPARNVVMSDDGEKLVLVRRVNDLLGATLDTYLRSGDTYTLVHTQADAIDYREPFGDIAASSCACKLVVTDGDNLAITVYRGTAGGDYVVEEVIPKPAEATLLRAVMITRGGQGIVAYGFVASAVRFYVFNWNGSAWVQEAGHVGLDAGVIASLTTLPEAYASNGTQALFQAAGAPQTLYTFDTGIEAYETVPACNTLDGCT